MSDDEIQWAWPFEEATKDDQFAHMAGAHHILHRSVTLHAEMHGVGVAVVPHKHLTPTEALMLRHRDASTDPVSLPTGSEQAGRSGTATTTHQ